MATSRPESQDRPYQHGDLPRAIVKAAVEILGETQSLEFSLRELARRAGVSHNAPYKHFADKRELLAAVSAAGFEQLFTLPSALRATGGTLDVVMSLQLTNSAASRKTLGWLGTTPNSTDAAAVLIGG